VAKPEYHSSGYWLFNCLFLAVALLLSACASTTDTTKPLERFTIDSLGDKTLVYGHIRMLENGEERYRDSPSTYASISPRYLRLEDMEQGALTIEPDGRFFWVLPGGTYMLHQVNWFDNWDGPHRIDPRLAFYVPTAINALCIGSLTIDIQGKRDFIGGLWIKGRSIKVEDHCDTLYGENINASLDKNKLLMVHNQGLPARPESLENRDKTIDFIRAIIPGLMTTIY